MKNLTMLCILILTSCVNPSSYENQDKIITSWAKSVSMKNPEIPTITAKELKIRLSQKDLRKVLVDARSMEEQKTSIIPGAMPREFIDQNLDNFRGKTIIAYCTIGSRSSAYLKGLQAKGFEVQNLYGGVLAWAQAGYLFESEGKESKKVKFLNDAWNVLPKGYEGIVP